MESTPLNQREQNLKDLNNKSNKQTQTEARCSKAPWSKKNIAFVVGLLLVAVAASVGITILVTRDICPSTENTYTTTESSLVTTTASTTISTTFSSTTSTTTEETLTSVLILSTALRDNIPVILTTLGQADKSFDFSYASSAEVYKSCSVTFQNEYFVFGGYKQKRQISKIEGCQLKRIASLSFNLEYGGCANVADNQVYVCFPVRPHSGTKSNISKENLLK